jgi:hypothetical protein
MVMDGRLAYYLTDFNVQVEYPLKLSDLEGYDLLVHSSSMDAIYTGRLGWRNSEFIRYQWNLRVFEPETAIDGVHIMRVIRTDPPRRKRDPLLAPKREIP